MSKTADLKDGQPDPLMGVLLDDYKITKLLGKGGMARVYEARDTKLGRRVAVKVMQIEPDEFDSEVAQRFFREARAVANLDHPNIVTVYRFGEGPGLYYIAMKLIEGQTLQAMLKNARRRKRYMEPVQVVQVLSEIGSALDYAHKQGVVHRDIKPSNIMITPDHHAVLMDFGLLMQAGAESTLGTAFGTPRYISPEQAVASNRATPQSDIYSLGVVTYEMVTGQTPFEGDSPMNLALNHINNPPPPPKTLRPDLSDAIQLVILKALEKQPNERWPNAMAMVDALRKAYGGTLPKVSVSSELLEHPAVRLTTVSAPIPASAKAHSPDGGDSTKVLPPTKEITVDDFETATGGTSLRRKSKRRTGIGVGIALLILLLIGGVISVRQHTQAADLGVIVTKRPTADLRLIYTENQLVIANISGKPISLAGLILSSADQAGKFDLSDFTAFETARCIVLFPRGQDPTADTLPALCAVNPILRQSTFAFWSPKQGMEFALKAGPSTLAVCSTHLNTCEVTLSR